MTECGTDTSNSTSTVNLFPNPYQHHPLYSLSLSLKSEMCLEEDHLDLEEAINRVGSVLGAPLRGKGCSCY